MDALLYDDDRFLVKIAIEMLVFGQISFHLHCWRILLDLTTPLSFVQVVVFLP